MVFSRSMWSACPFPLRRSVRGTRTCIRLPWALWPSARWPARHRGTRKLSSRTTTKRIDGHVKRKLNWHKLCAVVAFLYSLVCVPSRRRSPSAMQRWPCCSRYRIGAFERRSRRRWPGRGSSRCANGTVESFHGLFDRARTLKRLQIPLKSSHYAPRCVSRPANRTEPLVKTFQAFGMLVWTLVQSRLGRVRY